MSDVIDKTALELARLIRRRELGAVELLDMHLANIERRNDELHAFVQLFPQWARKQAAKIDGPKTRWPDLLPTFFGVPFAIKDQDPMKWTFTRLGSRAYRFAFTPFDSPVVRRMRAAGFVMVGKTSTSEFALLPIVEPDTHPPTLNPWDRARTAGGSSGGAAAAVASGMVPIAHGADGGGSIRIPASFCGLYGYKASRGVMPHFYGPLESVGLSVAGTLSRSVEDAAAALDALCGDPFSGRDSWLERSSEAPPDNLRVRFTAHSNISDVHPEVEQAVMRVAAVLEAMGHDVDEGVGFEGSIDEFVPVYGRLAANVPVLRESELQPSTRWLRSVGKGYTNKQARAINTGLSERLDDWFGGVDLLVTPTVGILPPAVNAYRNLAPDQVFRKSAVLGAFTGAFNITGQPAASIPVAVTADGVPIGVQIVGRRGADALVMQIARVLHEAGGWTIRSRSD